MKKIMFILVAVALLTVTSCSKEYLINRQLDGSWTAVTYNGEATQSNYGFEVTFSKDKDGKGTGSSTYITPLGSGNSSFTYDLVEDQLTMTSTDGSIDPIVVTVNTYTKDKIQWTDSEGKITVLQPK